MLGGLDAMVGEEPVLNAVLQALTGEGDVADARESLALLRWADKQERARQRAAVAAEREGECSRADGAGVLSQL